MTKSEPSPYYEVVGRVNGSV